MPHARLNLFVHRLGFLARQCSSLPRHLLCTRLSLCLCTGLGLGTGLSLSLPWRQLQVLATTLSLVFTWGCRRYPRLLLLLLCALLLWREA